ncbi:MAG: YbhB/YbcL family Raf kinase inhibitor-like protein [Acidimicrobiia bacterium]|nr:YbhB/YbcL family Raf kinase inhibitor-like protein [Acidimicrobiia bacterium]
MAYGPGLTLVAGLILLGACGTQTVTDAEPLISSTTSPGGTMQITSPAFTHNGPIPDSFTCRGDDINPPLEITGVPNDAISLVLIVDDPDAPDPAAPKVVWEHWVMWNIAPTTTTIEPGTVPTGAVQGTNSWGRTDYGGPCPPIGTHRYFFKLYALDTTLALTTASIKADVESAMQGHILAAAELVGLYGG